MKLTQQQLDAWLKKWQPRLRLADWTIKVELVRRRDIDGNLGRCDTTVNRKLAHIAVADAQDRPADSQWPDDPEQILVHELLHCHFVPFAAKLDDSPEDVAQEQAIDAIALAIVECDRSKRRR